MDSNFTKECIEIRERLKGVEESTKSAHHRLDELNELTKAVVKTSASIEYIAKQIEDMLTTLKEHDCSIDKLKNRPAEQVLNYWHMFVGTLVTGCAGVLVGLLFRGGF